MRERQIQKIEVHVAGICFRETETGIEVLIAKRQSNRKLYPGKWECGGGQVNAGENFVSAVKRQMREELGVIVGRAVVFGTYEIDAPELEQKKIPGIKFICFWKEYSNGTGPEIDGDEFSEFRWQSIEELGGIDFIDGIVQDIRTGWDFYSNCKRIVD
jgi:8-oxo-dGTP pyrophosphatase MutT (NUDIX family)